MKAPAKKVATEQAAVIEVPSVPRYCDNCKYSEVHNERLVCKVPLPPCLTRTGAIPFVNTTYTCPLHTFK